MSPNGSDWRQLPLPGEQPRFDHAVEARGFLVNGHLAVVHTSGSEAVVSILDTVENAVPLNTGAAPDLPFAVADPGDQVEVGIEYGYPIYTHCGLPTIGPLNDVHWIGVPETADDVWKVPGWGGNVLGLIVLTASDEIQYRVGGQVIARYRPEPDHETSFCF